MAARWSLPPMMLLYITLDPKRYTLTGPYLLAWCRSAGLRGLGFRVLSLQMDVHLTLRTFTGGKFQMGGSLYKGYMRVIQGPGGLYKG